MKNSGEEFECAQELDRLPEVEFWVRNLAGKQRVNSSFWLQTSTDRFYPDFVARLTDGRILVVEYKGEDYRTNDDSKEKEKLGQIWAQLCGAQRGVFAMVWKSRGNRSLREQLQAAIR